MQAILAGDEPSGLNLTKLHRGVPERWAGRSPLHASLYPTAWQDSAKVQRPAWHFCPPAPPDKLSVQTRRDAE